jgi:hypothetical protein
MLTNAVAYYLTELIAVVKGFMVHSQGACTMHLFMSYVSKCFCHCKAIKKFYGKGMLARKYEARGEVTVILLQKVL